MKTAVVAIGGNALLLASEKGTLENQQARVNRTCRHLVKMVKNGYDIVITHGNGPQVGNILLQNEMSKSQVPPMPLDVCVAETQGQIGYLIQQSLANELKKAGIDKTVASIVTQVMVDKNDKAFKNPTKPIGPYYKKRRAEELIAIEGWVMKEDKARGGYRRVVPSPEPIDIVEKDVIRRLVFGGENQGEIVIVAGGGGIPVIKERNGYRGVEAVIDKDLASSVLATSIDEKLIIMLTDVKKVSINFKKKNQEDLSEVHLEEIRKYCEEGHFPPGSMGPKIQAAVRFLEKGGERVVITSIESLESALKGKEGTHITK